MGTYTLHTATNSYIHRSKIAITLLKKTFFSENWIVHQDFSHIDNFSVKSNMKNMTKVVQTGPKTGQIISVRNFSLINGRKHEKS